MSSLPFTPQLRPSRPRLRVQSVRRLAFATLTAGAVLLPTRSALAFCRQNACEDGIRKTCDNFEDPDDCTESEYLCERDENECINEGLTLHRLTNCMSYVVARGHAEMLGLTDEDLLGIVKEAFSRWQAVDCGGGARPGFRIPTLGLVDAAEAYYCSDPVLNMSTWFLAEEWTHDEKALGFTFSTSSVGDGVVHDADVELNLGKVKSDFGAGDWRAVLVSIATHEAGHFLGLAHSLDPNAVMFASYNRTNLHERVLTQDDFDGICGIFPPDPELVCEAPTLILPGLSEEACLAVLTPDAADPITSGSVDDTADDPMGEAVMRRGCAVSVTSVSTGKLHVLALFAALALCFRRRNQG